MDDGSPLYALFLFIGFVVVNAVMYSFEHQGESFVFRMILEI